MNDRPDRPGVDLERELVRYMAEHRITRRMLLEQVAKVGAFAALAPIIAACAAGAASSARHPSRRRSSAAPPSVAPSVAAAPTATPAPTPPSRPPRPSSTSGTTPSTWARTSSRRSSRRSRGLQGRHQGQLGLLRHVRGDVRAGHRRPDRLRHHVPGVDRRPGARRDQQDPAARPVAHPEQGQPRHRMGEPGLRPGQRALDAVHVVDDRRGLRHGQDQGGADQLEGALGRALEGPHRDARRPARGVRRGAHPARLQRQHGRRRRARPGARPAQAAAPARPAVQRRGPAVHGLGRHLDRPCLGLGHLHGPAEEAVGRVLHPRGGLGPRIGRGGHPRRRQEPRRGQPVHQPPARRPRQRRELELHRLHGPERGGQGSSSARTSSTRPGSTRTRPSSTSSRSCSTWASTWTSTRRAGPS